MIRFVTIKQRLKQALIQVKVSWHDALGAGVAAGIAWFISVRLLGHDHPIYAAMTALVCLAPGLPSHGRQAIYVLVGVLTGVLVGEATLLLPTMPTAVRIALVGFAGLTIASAYAIVPAMIIQAGVSAVMVFALGSDVAGFTRVIDVFVGTCIGLLFSQVLFTPDQLSKLRASIERFFHELSINLTMAADGLESSNAANAIRALKGFGRTHLALVGVISAIDIARNNARWTLRGRMASRAVVTLSARYDQSAIRLYASALLFCEALVRSIRKQRELPPAWLVGAIKLAADNCRFLAGEGRENQSFVIPDRTDREEPPLSWRECAAGIELVENILARVYKSKTRKQRLASFRERQIFKEVHDAIKKRRKSNDILIEEVKLANDDLIDGNTQRSSK